MQINFAFKYSINPARVELKARHWKVKVKEENSVSPAFEVATSAQVPPNPSQPGQDLLGETFWMDSYTILGLVSGAGEEEVKKAYKSLAKR